MRWTDNVSKGAWVGQLVHQDPLLGASGCWGTHFNWALASGGRAEAAALILLIFYPPLYWVWNHHVMVGKLPGVALKLCRLSSVSLNVTVCSGCAPPAGPVTSGFDYELAAQGVGVLRMLRGLPESRREHCHACQNCHGNGVSLACNAFTFACRREIIGTLLFSWHTFCLSAQVSAVPGDRGDPGAPKWDSHWGMERLSQLNPGGCSPTEEQRLSGRSRQTRDERTRTFPKRKTAGKPQPRSACREVVVGVRRTLVLEQEC